MTAHGKKTSRSAPQAETPKGGTAGQAPPGSPHNEGVRGESFPPVGFGAEPQRSPHLQHPLFPPLTLSGMAEGWDEDAESSPITSEDACLALLDAYFPSRTEHVPFGRGDDCAELRCPSPELALSTDFFWQDVHFRTAYFTPEEAGAKALTTAVSDLAGAGAVPLGFSLGLMLPPYLGEKALRRLLSGMANAARRYGIALSGGDLSRGDALGFCITVWGAPLGDGAGFLRRGEANPGDFVFLIGQTGLAGLGLWELEREGRAALTSRPEACAAFLAPKALLAEGQSLARLAHANATLSHRLSLMDVSDGLARDLPRLLGGLGADLTFDDTVLHAEARAAAALLGVRADALCLSGGEDYALLGSCAERLWPSVQEAVPGVTLLGRATAAPGLFRHGIPLLLDGFDHFSTRGEERTASSRSAFACPASPGGEVPGGFSVKRGVGEGKADNGVLPATLPDGPVLEGAQALIAFCRSAWKSGLLAGYNGNASCRIPLGAGREGCLITRSGAVKSSLTERDFALLSIDGGELLAGERPSSESALHLAVYAACPETRAILHTHPPHLLALNIALPPEQRLQLPLPEARTYLARLAFVPALAPGSGELAQATAQAAAGCRAVWLENHGLVAHGLDFLSALALTEELEHLAKVQLLALL